MAKIVKTLRNNWKKSIFACVVSYYGIDYLLERRRQFHVMRALCEQAGKHGRKPLPEGAVNKHITLFLNPAASNRKGRTKFEKFAEPLLHMAGFLVTIVRTEKVDHAKELSALINKTNIIAVAGGGGTLSEVVTGLLRREDADEAVLKYPIGIIPVGFDNEFADFLGLSKAEKEPYRIADAAMAIVNHQIKPQDVLEIQVMEDQVQEGEGGEEMVTGEEKKHLKPVYAMSGLRLGMFREALKKKSEMASFMSEYWKTFWSFFRTQQEIFKAEIRYTPPCKGCLRCVQENVKLRNSQSSSWFSYFTSFFRPPSKVEKVVPLVDNPDCGTWSSLCVETPEFNVRPNGDGSLVMEIGKRYNSTEFIKEGFNIMKNGKREMSNEIEFSEAEIIPIQAPQFCSIDGDEFEVKPLHIKILRKKLYFFSAS